MTKNRGITITGRTAEMSLTVERLLHLGFSPAGTVQLPAGEDGSPRAEVTFSWPEREQSEIEGSGRKESEG